jgi:hypothetical protein
MDDKYNYTYHKIVGGQMEICHGTIEEILADTTLPNTKISLSATHNQLVRSNTMDSNKKVNPKLETSRIEHHSDTRDKTSTKPKTITTTTGNNSTNGNKSEGSEISYVGTTSVKSESDDCIITEVRRKIPVPITPSPRKRRALILNRKTSAKNGYSVDTPVLLQRSNKKEKDDISSLCLFCGNKECHDIKYGAYCRNVCVGFIKDKTNRNVCRSKLFEVFQRTYGCILNWEHHKKKGNNLHESVSIINEVPECMMNGSYTQFLIQYSDAN